MGFERVQAEAALAQAQGSVDLALNILLQPPSTTSDTFQDEEEERITILDMSQYSFDGVGASACTAIACQVAASLLQRLRDDAPLHDEQFLSNCLYEGIHVYNTHMFSRPHTNPEEILTEIDHFTSQLAPCAPPLQGVLSHPQAFEELFARARASLLDPSRSCALVLTKPPETITIVIPPTEDGTYAFFDSHARPQFGIDGACLATCTSRQNIIMRLTLLFGSAENYEVESSLMEEMYNSFEAVVVQTL